MTHALFFRVVSPAIASMAVTGIAALVSSAHAQPIGPDLISSSHVDVARYGTDATGAITSYAIGAVTCNHGDLPALVSPPGNSILRPLIGQNMYRLKTYTTPGGSYQRFEQVGQSWAKRVGLPISASQSTCGTCIPTSSGYMGVNCADTYGSGFNGSQGLLGPRSMINPTIGASTGGAGTAVGDNIIRGRIQVPTVDVINQPADTRFFVETVTLLPDDAQYVRSGAMVAVNAMNNAASQEISINAGLSSPTLLGTGNSQIAALYRWQQADPAVVIVTADHDDYPNPSPAFPGTFIRSRFIIAARVTPLAGGQWRYEYNVFNLNSDRAGGSLSFPFSSAASFSDGSFRHPIAHSGEPYSNAPWGASRSGETLTLATDPFTTNPNANAVRWGTTYSLGFTTNVPPITGGATLGLFRPGPGTSNINITGLPVPSVPGCSADFNNDTSPGTDADIEAFFGCLSGNCCPTCPANADFNIDGDVGTDADIESFFRVLSGGPC